MVLEFRTLVGTLLWTFGAKLVPSSQQSIQNSVLDPLPIVVTAEIANKAEVFGCTGMSRPAHGRSGLFFWSHHFLPSDQTAASIYFLPPFLKKTSSYFVNCTDKPFRDLDCDQQINWNGSENNAN